MSQDPVDEFLDSAHQSGLLSADEAATLSRELRESGAATRQDVAAKLVEKNVLTPFQAEQLLAGRGGECMLAGRYSIRQKLGAGAMGAVYLAVDKKLDRAVAIKMLPSQSVTDAGAVARFQREAKALAKLSHPNIIQAYDSDEDAGRQFLVMEYAEGMNLNELIRAKGRIAPALAADYMYQAALGLQNAHEKGLVHRDLKPGNLLLTPHGQVKILDLGLARFLQDQVGDATLTREGSGMGTPDYMAPEQFHDARHVDARSDIYSLGCTLYHLITGRVPFPGTSMSEKYAAHEQQEPPPLEEFCPDVPAGLALAVQRMMAKRPADRFQSAREVAEALFPHVAGSSHAILNIKATASWQGSQLGISIARGSPRPTRQRRAVIAACVAALLLLAVAYPVFFRRNEPKGNPNGPIGTTPPASRVEPPDPNVLTVAQDGSGDFQTIGEALKQVTAGKTIRVLDAATYSESLSIDDADRHARIVLEATQGAVIEMPAGSSNALSIDSVGEVNVRGFRFRGKAARPNSVFIGVSGQSPGVVLERLDIQSDSNVDGIRLQNLAISETDRPLVVTACEIRFNRIAISAYGTGNGPSRRIWIRDNRVSGCPIGVKIEGTVSATVVTGNLLWGCGFAGIQFQDLALDSDVLLANNTVYKSDSGLRLWLNSPIDTRPPGEVTVTNNLLFGCSNGDMMFVNGTDGSGRPQPGDGTSLTKSWRFANNFRDLLGTEASLIVPLAANDRKLQQVDIVSRNTSDHDFLRPAKDSPLASEGAGGDLPTYVGAVPPEGAPPWDWQKTWDERHPKTLLTVSKDPKDGGEFRSINDALEKVNRPGMTIRVLDSATYEESVWIKISEHFAGLTLEAPKRATIKSPPGAIVAVLVRSVPRVRVTGFRVEAQDANTILVGVYESSPGVRLDNLECHGGRLSDGISIDSVTLGPTDEPVVIHDCTITECDVGIQLVGLNLESRRAQPTRKVIVHNNAVSNCDVGIWATGLIQDLHVTSNKIWSCATAGIRVVELLDGSSRILVSNNSVKGRKHCVEFMEPLGHSREVEFRNNLLITEAGPDIVFTGSDREVLKSWTIERNWRQVQPPDLADPAAKAWVPGTKDQVLEKIALISNDPENPNFLRPAKDSPLATGGGGNGLPAYIGAVPPEGVEPWDWTKTWKDFPWVRSGDSKQQP